jgi:hypothetical protein
VRRLHDIRRRGLPDPLLVVSDGPPGMIREIEECLPRTARQRCLAHKVRNLQSKVPEDLWPEFNACAVGLLPSGLTGASVKESHSSVLVGYLRHRRSSGH